MDPEEANKLTPTKVITNYRRKRQLENYHRAIQKRNFKIDDLRVEIQRLRNLMTPQQLKLYEDRYADEDRDLLRELRRKSKKAKMSRSLTVEESEDVRRWLEVKVHQNSE